MTVSVIVAYQPTPARDPLWQFMRAYWEREHPDWELVVGTDESPGMWNKGAALRNAARQAQGDILVMADADTYPVGRENVAVEIAQTVPVQVFPFGELVKLTWDATQSILAGIDSFEVDWTWRSPSSLFAMQRDSYWEVGGIDPRFTGWCFEDTAFNEACTTILGPDVRTEGWYVYHLWHPWLEGWPDARQAPENQALINRYHAAQGDPVAMRQLVAEHKDAP